MNCGQWSHYWIRFRTFFPKSFDLAFVPLGQMEKYILRDRSCPFRPIKVKEALNSENSFFARFKLPSVSWMGNFLFLVPTHGCRLICTDGWRYDGYLQKVEVRVGHSGFGWHCDGTPTEKTTVTKDRRNKYNRFCSLFFFLQGSTCHPLHI